MSTPGDKMERCTGSMEYWGPNVRSWRYGPKPADFSYEAYLVDAQRVSFLTKDLKSMSIDKQRLVRCSAVFRDMFEINRTSGLNQGSTLSLGAVPPIDVDVSAELLGQFFDLIAQDKATMQVTLCTGVEDTFQLHKLADKFEVEKLKQWTDARMSSMDGWDILEVASKIDDTELARCRIRRLPLFKKDNKELWTKSPSYFWDNIGELQLSWQIELIRLLFPSPRVTRKDESSSTLWSRTIIDLDDIADYFDP